MTPPARFQSPSFPTLLASVFDRFRPTFAAAVLFCCATDLRAQIPAFPGAEGYGAYAKGGRGGDVYHVTNLNPSGAGSFANGIATVPSAGRTIVFDVSGYIRFPSGSNGTRMTSSKVTIAGQTAPGDGIGFTNNFFRISGDDIVLRHLRFRHGKNGSGGDCIDLDSGSVNSVLDHLSIQFSTDENMSSFGSPPENVTLQYSLNAWGLESHSCGGLWDQNHATSHHNLWAHNHTRNPKARPNGLLEWVNNVTFDWDIGYIMGDSQSVQNWKSNLINNYFICPPGNIKSKALVKGTVATNGQPNFTIHLSGNLIDLNGDGSLGTASMTTSHVEGSVYSAAESPAPAAGSSRYHLAGTAIPGSAAGVAADPALMAYRKIVSNAGALRLDASYTGGIRDEVDTILISKLVNQQRAHVTRESDTGASASGFGTLNSTAAPADTDRDGMPDFYEAALAWNVAVQDHNTALASSGGLLTSPSFMPASTVAGYTRLEEYLHYLAIPHGTVAKNIAGSPTSITVDLRKYTSGFAPSTPFQVGGAVNGSIQQYLADGTTISATGPIVKFTPTQGYVGRARFDFTVTEAGQPWLQTFALVVTNAGLPRDLVWKGTGNIWDGTASTWRQQSTGATVAFSAGDRVALDQMGVAQPNVMVTGNNQPGSVEVNAADNYNFVGGGAIASSGELIKRGMGTLTISNAGPNTFTAATLESGALTIGNNTALGTAPLTIVSGTLNIGANAPTGSALTIAGPATITGGDGGGSTGIGAVNGSGPLTIAQTNVFDLRGDLSGYTGVVNFTGNSTIRLNGALGSAPATFDLGTGTTFLVKRSSAVNAIPLGALIGGGGTGLQGASGTGNTTATTYVIGATGLSTTFAGAISNGGGAVTIDKVGSGTLTLSGTSNHTGATNVGGVIYAVSVTAGGSGYTSAPAVVITGGGGTGATASASIANGAVTRVTIASPGVGYTSVPTVAFSGGGGTGAAATATAPFGGALVVSGTLNNTAVRVASGALLGGGGAMNGGVTATAGALLSPGTLPFTGGTMNVSTGLSLGAATLYCDMLSSPNPPAGTNDRISVNSGALTFTGTPFFQFLLLEGTLSAGDYDLITAPTSVVPGGTPGAFPHNLPAGTRQTFTVKRTAGGATPSRVWLEVLGDPATLTWSGATTSTWDATTGTNWGGASPSTFGSNDAVVFDDSSTNLNPVAISGSVAPRSVLVSNSGRAYTFSGAGAIIDASSLTKTGPGVLTIANTGTSNFHGGTFLNGGRIALADSTANASGLGTGPITFNGGTLTMAGFTGANSAEFAPLPNALIVPAGQTGTLQLTQRAPKPGSANVFPALYGALSGGGTLNLEIKFVRADLLGDWSAFTGVLNVVAVDGDGGDFRFGTNGSWPGLGATTVNLGAKMAAYYVGTSASGAGTTIEIGELRGTSTSYLGGGNTGGRNFAYRIGGKTLVGSEAVFAGTIAEQGVDSFGNVPTSSIVKTGAGIWTLSGTCNLNGSTTVEQGTLRISGSLTTPQPIAVQNTATLDLAGGTLNADSVNIAANATLSGHGTIHADLNNEGNIPATTGGALVVTGDVVNNGTMRIGNGTALSATGGFVNNGVLDLLTAASGLPPNLINHGIVIDSSTLRTVAAAKSGNTVTLTVEGHSGHMYQLQRATRLITPDWVNVSGSVANGVTQANGQPTPFALQDTNATGTQRFYRVQVTP